jgi:hypothetical protein
MRKIILFCFVLMGVLAQAQESVKKGLNVGTTSTGIVNISSDELKTLDGNTVNINTGYLKVSESVKGYTAAQVDSIANLKANTSGQDYTGAHNFTGATITAPTKSVGTNTTDVATMEALQSGLATKANTGANFVLRYLSTQSLSPADATSYYFGAFPVKALDANATYHQDILPIACKLVAATIITHSAGACTQETYSLYIRKNNTTDYLISSAIFNGTASALPYQYTATGLNNTYAAGDKIEMKLVTPTWVTNPTTYYIQVDLYFTIP